MTNVVTALRSEAAVEAVFVSPKAPDAVVDTARERGVPVLHMEDSAFDRITDTVTPQPVAAVVGFVDRPLNDLADAGFVVVCADVRDPGNAGTIMRAAESAGGDGVICTDGSVDVYNPKTVRASAGSLFEVPLVAGGEAVTVVNQLREFGLTTVVASAHGGKDPSAVDLRRRTALILGNEAWGVDPVLEAAADEVVTIPLSGRSESLNVAMAGAVLCFEVSRQRRQDATA